MRVGIGYDAHRLVEGRKLILGGVEIPHETGLLGHSDADVLTHAVIDALLGAARLGDIGRLFPDNNPEFKGISSLILLKNVYNKLQNLDYRLINVDAAISAQKPKLAGFIPQMEEKIAAAMGVDVDCISVKATTTENMGFVGTGEGMAAHAVALIEKVIK
ncbi:MAG: 2-C-methyl-D-erythritol 2,4-cyclodiphosphate synthase [Defluviitaleaceae bacterium]|nr:2-C-methyl-D-erythritol 2,4-cyclodiphosphate synthase [Defluviitaleaceae bacterium]